MAEWITDSLAATGTTVDLDGSTTSRDFADSPAGLTDGSVTAVDLAATTDGVTYEGLNGDTLSTGVRFMSGTTVMAAADAGGGYVAYSAARTTAGTIGTPAVSFPYVNTAASKADWDLTATNFIQNITKDMAPDGCRATFATVTDHITITYTVAAVVPILSAATSTAITDVTATVGCTTDEANGTLYAYVYSSATPPSVADLKSGSGSVFSDSTTSAIIGANTFNATSLIKATTYWTHFLHTGANGDSAILTSASLFTKDRVVLSNPSITGIGDTVATLNCDTDYTDDNSAYFYVKTSSTPPSVSEMISGVGAAFDGSTLNESITLTLEATGLLAGTQYWGFIYEEPLSNDLASTVFALGSFTTTAGASFVAAWAGSVNTLL